MGALTREKGVLKFVHPGRYVEIHTEPITAAEVMKRNPRHSVTRTDVFDYPWIVVKPEAVLVPGKVFLIVPNRTIYDLLKAKGHHSQPCSSRQIQSSKNHVSQQDHTQSSPIKSYAGTTPKHQSHHRSLKHQFKNLYCYEVSSGEEDFDKKHKKQSQVEYRALVIANYMRTEQKFKRELLEDSTTEFRFSHPNETYYNNNNIRAKLAKTQDLHLESECSTSKQVTMLKSCLRQPDSFRKFLHLRVTFDLPVNDEAQQKRLSVRPTEFADFLNW